MEGIKKQGTPALRVLELFAGVGGFRFGLNEVKNDAGNAFEVVWANQFEPSSKKQWAADVYKARWGSADLVNEDIFKVLDDEAAMARIDALCPDMLVGGFPCQDYSVAQPLSRSQGLAGKKGVLWWSIHRLLEARLDAGSPVKYVMLENVDRLLSTPTACRGRDFAVILAALQSLGYAVEWRVVNAADYGHAQKRRRVFLIAYHKDTALYAKLAAKVQQDASDWMLSCGVLASALPAQLKDGSDVRSFAVQADVYAAQETYTPVKGRSQFAAGGVCLAGQVWTGDMQAQAFSDYTQFTGQRRAMTLGDVVGQTTQEVAQRFFLTPEALPRWQALKGAKSSPRVNASGHAYEYKEGAVAFPDPLQRPARTIITSEGGTCASRTSHVVAHADGRLRRLVPEELEALNGFDRGFTDIPNIPAAKRAFLMGNALVTGLVTRLGKVLSAEHAAGTPPPAPAKEGARATEQPAESSMVTVSGVQTLSQAGGQPLVQQRLLLGEVDLHRGVGDIQHGPGEGVLPLLEKLQHLRQVPDRWVAAVHWRRKPLVVANHELAHVLSGQAHHVSRIGQPDEIGTRLDQHGAWQGPFHIINRAEQCSLCVLSLPRKIQPDIPRLAQAHHGIGTALLAQAFNHRVHVGHVGTELDI